MILQQKMNNSFSCGIPFPSRPMTPSTGLVMHLLSQHSLFIMIIYYSTSQPKYRIQYYLPVTCRGEVSLMYSTFSGTVNNELRPKYIKMKKINKINTCTGCIPFILPNLLHKLFNKLNCDVTNTHAPLIAWSLPKAYCLLQ